MFLHFETRRDLRLREKQVRFIDDFMSSHHQLEWQPEHDSLIEGNEQRNMQELVAQLGTDSGIFN